MACTAVSPCTSSPYVSANCTSQLRSVPEKEKRTPQRAPFCPFFGPATLVFRHSADLHCSSGGRGRLRDGTLPRKHERRRLISPRRYLCRASATSHPFAGHRQFINPHASQYFPSFPLLGFFFRHSFAVERPAIASTGITNQASHGITYATRKSISDAS
jgi:hypothetical protein